MKHEDYQKRISIWESILIATQEGSIFPYDIYDNSWLPHKKVIVAFISKNLTFPNDKILYLHNAVKFKTSCTSQEKFFYT